MGFGGGAFGTGSYTYSVIDNQTIQLNQQKGVIYANATISEIQNIVSQNGAISGTIAYSEPSSAKYYKKFIATLSNFQNQSPSNLLSNSGTTGIGEAPQLSSTYAQYDNGASVFNFYDNFAGTSLNTSKWILDTGVNPIVNNGITLPADTSVGINSRAGIVANTTNLGGTNFVIEFYGYSTANSSQDASVLSVVLSSSSTSYSGTNNVLYNLYSNQGGFSCQTSAGTFSGVSFTPTSPSTFYIESINVSGTSAFAGYNEYSQYTSSLTAYSDTNEYAQLSTSVNSGINTFAYWFRIRSYPPNNVMPSVSFGSFTSSSGATITIPSGIDYYMPITITNNQSVATPSPFQQMIQININNYSDYMYFDGNIANFELFTSTGTIIPAWIESNNNGTLTIWAKLSSGIGANSSITIYLGVANIYQFSINYPVAFSTEANITYNSGFTASTTLTALTITLNSLQQMNGTIIVEGY